MYPVRLAVKSLWFDRWINILTVLTIGTGLFILGMIMLILFNIEGVTRRLPERFSITVFLSDDLSDSAGKRLTSRIEREPVVKKAIYISREEALEELRTSLKDAAYILEGLNENPLFPSIEIRLNRDRFDAGRVGRLIEEIRGIKGVEDVVYGEDLLGAIHNLSRGFKTVSGGLVVLFSVAIVFVCYSTVKILFYRRKEEIEIFKLLGATKGFIRLPFLIEGSILGLLSGILGGVGIFALYRAVSGLAASELPFLGFMYFPVEIILFLPAGGLILGVIGSSIAMGRLRY